MSMAELDCGDNSCEYAKDKRGMRTNGGCRCNECPWCGRNIRPTGYSRHKHLDWCSRPDWLPGMPVGVEQEAANGVDR